MATFSTRQVERERPDEDFTVECESGNVYALPHPKSISGYELLGLNVDDLPGVFMALLGDDYYAFMHEPEIDGFALDSIFEAWTDHYGLGRPGNGRASRRPSSVTPPRSKRTSRGATPASPR